MLPIPNSNVSFGQATQMSKNDIDRLNRLYQCCKYTLLFFKSVLKQYSCVHNMYFEIQSASNLSDGDTIQSPCSIMCHS